MRTCDECKMAPSCGWCNDASDTGLGVCMTGGATGPTQPGTGAALSSNACPADQWFFTDCPCKYFVHVGFSRFLGGLQRAG